MWLLELVDRFSSVLYEAYNVRFPDWWFQAWVVIGLLCFAVLAIVEIAQEVISGEALLPPPDISMSEDEERVLRKLHEDDDDAE